MSVFDDENDSSFSVQVEQAVVIGPAEPANAESLRVSLVESAGPREGTSFGGYVAITPGDVGEIGVAEVYARIEENA